ncbi:MAG: endonuclease/exonuclease/phosphatase family protein [Nanoarchaeota archaeon]|nr:endonuclease/exonuclease/phosphatase family protein [Nanoarchaeota archaeon]MBU1854247.1 endonuclease/exonuclease/phosphatase family protein [Nanoarchaeota archaeon]
MKKRIRKNHISKAKNIKKETKDKKVMPIKLITINIEGNKHLDKIIPFIKKEKPDVLCVQEVFLQDLKKLKEASGLEGWFMPCYKKDSTQANIPKGEEVIEGIALLTNLPNRGVKTYYLKKKHLRTYKDFTKVPRGIIQITIISEQKEYNIATTHYTWTPNGEINKNQKEDFKKLLKFTRQFSGLILCGDFNAPRGREMFSKFTDHFKDNLPPEIDTTIDSDIHRKGLKLVVDTIFSTPHYKVSNVRVVGDVSDHKAVIGYIE